jgi:hypothetical protein
MLSVVISTFNYDRAVAGNNQLQTTNIQPLVWMDDTPRMALSEDGVPMVYHIPQAMKPNSTVSSLSCLVPVLFIHMPQAILFTQLLDLVDSIGKLPKIAGADQVHRNAKSSYKIVPGEVAGVFKMARAWHAIGHEVRKINLVLQHIL